MKPERVYLAGLALVGGIGALLVLGRPVGERPGMWLGLGVGLLAQGPLGWWLIRSVGTRQFLGVWALGMLARFVVLGVMAFAVLPRPGRSIGPGLLTLAAVIVILLFFEGVVLWLKQRSKA